MHHPAGKEIAVGYNLPNRQPGTEIVEERKVSREGEGMREEKVRATGLW